MARPISDLTMQQNSDDPVWALYKMPNGSLFQIVERTDDTVRFTAQGGGIVRSLPAAEFDAQFTPTGLPEFARAHASGDWLPDGVVIDCLSNGTRWNGWSCPYFDYEGALQLCQHMPGLIYDQAKDCFSYPCDDNNLERTEFHAETIDVQGQTTKVYPIGSGFWCWN